MVVSFINPLKFNWTDVCPTGLKPWIPDSNDLAPCFQQISLQLPTLAWFAIFSAYHFGRQAILVVRNDTQMRVIYLRVFVVLCLAFVPVLKTATQLYRHFEIYPSDILISCVECVAWIVHMGNNEKCI